MFACEIWENLASLFVSAFAAAICCWPIFFVVMLVPCVWNGDVLCFCQTALSEPRPFTRDSKLTDKSSRRRGFILYARIRCGKYFWLRAQKLFSVTFSPFSLFPIATHNTCTRSHWDGLFTIAYFILYTMLNAIERKKHRKFSGGLIDTYNSTVSFAQKESCIQCYTAQHSSDRTAFQVCTILIYSHAYHCIQMREWYKCMTLD